MERITQLPPDHIFVFGSNRAGRHGLGAAKDAYTYFDAIYGRGEGLQGRSYAIPTKDRYIRTLPLESIAKHIATFEQFTKENKHLVFVVTEIGCGLAGYTVEEIAPMFKFAINSENIILPDSFLKVLQ